MKKGFRFYILLFGEMFRLSAFTLGGGYVIISLMRERFVSRLHWIDEKEMLDFAAIAQSAPGALAINAAVLLGTRLGGAPGAAVSILGTALPPLLILSALSYEPTLIADGLKGLESDEQMQNGNGYDHNFCLNGAGMREVAIVTAPDTGRVMRVSTDQPGVQFYAGNGLRGVNDAKCGRKYEKREGFCLETQVYPDAINHENFPTCVLKAGEKYDTTTIYAFGVC